jgi:dUTP pyrophosphatase
MQIKLKRLDPTLPVPKAAKEGDAGVDFYAADKGSVTPGNRVLVHLGVAIELPAGKVLLVCPRSGLAEKGISITNAPGVVDEGYRGELMAWVEHRGHPYMNPFYWDKGDRLCQGIVVDYTPIEFVEVEDLSETARGATGFGSTGVNFKLEGSAKDLTDAIGDAAIEIKKSGRPAKK